MKHIFKYSLLAVLLLLILSSCETIENRDEFAGILDKSVVRYEIKQNPARPNQIYLLSSTPKAIPYWDYETGISHKTNDTIFIPFEGTYWIKYYAYAGGIPFADSTRFSLPQDDEFFNHPYWNLLTNGAQGKTWVWAVGNPEGGKLFGIGPISQSNPDNWLRGFAWWSTNNPADLEAGEFTLDLNKACNYNKTTPTGGTQKGSFVFDIETKYIRFIGPKMLHSQVTENPQDRYKVVLLTEDELVLLQVNGTASQRPFYFKRKGHIY